jgi:hypothetical protein
MKLDDAKKQPAGPACMVLLVAGLTAHFARKRLRQNRWAAIPGPAPPVGLVAHYNSLTCQDTVDPCFGKIA